MYLFFYMALGHNGFDAGKSITQVFGREGGLKIFACCHLWPKKVPIFRVSPLPMALVMYIARLKIISPRAIETRGTLMFIIKLMQTYTKYVYSPLMARGNSVCTL